MKPGDPELSSSMAKTNRSKRKFIQSPNDEKLQASINKLVDEFFGTYHIPGNQSSPSPLNILGIAFRRDLHKASKYVGRFAREQGGFGSAPAYDDFSDEGGAD
jgi:hypothetical protein